MATSIILLGVLVVVGLLLVARYGADSRGTGDPTGRDAGWPSTPTREHTPAEDLTLVRALVAGWTRHLRAWEVFERSLRPWEEAPVERTRRSIA